MVGYDDSSMAQLSPVPLTTVAQRPDELGRLAVERMVARVEQRRIVDREIVLAGRAAECGRARLRRRRDGVIHTTFSTH